MGRIIKLTLLADIFSCFMMFIYLTIVDSFGMGLYAGILTFGNILIPTLGAVIIFTLINRRTTISNPIQTIVLQSIILCLVFIFGLFVWATIDVYLFDTLTWENIENDYKSQFAGFLPVVFTEALLIPSFYFLLNRQKQIMK